MRVLQIGSDRSIFDAKSASAERMRAYGKRFGELDIIIFSLRKHGVKSVGLGNGVYAHATNSFSRLSYWAGAIWIGLRVSRPDVISVQDPFEAGLIGWIISFFRRAPLHVQVHTDFLSPEFGKLSMLNRLRILIAGFVLRRASRIRVVSNRIKNSLEARSSKLAARITVLPIFVDVEKYRKAQASETLMARADLFSLKFLVVSRLEPEKNVELAIRAFARAAIEKSCLLIVGAGSERKRLEKIVEKTGAGKWIFFEGQENPADYYKFADLLLHPSLYDGYGMVIIEALASGIPVLSADVGIAREAGAIIASQEEFAAALKEWGKNGPRAGVLKNYPYKNFEEYVHAYCNDIRLTAK